MGHIEYSYRVHTYRQLTFLQSYSLGVCICTPEQHMGPRHMLTTWYQSQPAMANTASTQPGWKHFKDMLLVTVLIPPCCCLFHSRMTHLSVRSYLNTLASLQDICGMQSDTEITDFTQIICEHMQTPTCCQSAAWTCSHSSIFIHCIHICPSIFWPVTHNFAGNLQDQILSRQNAMKVIHENTLPWYQIPTFLVSAETLTLRNWFFWVSINVKVQDISCVLGICSR